MAAYRFVLPFCQIGELFDRLSVGQRLYMPQPENGRAYYREYQKGSVYAYEAVNTYRSPKDFFFPQVENIALYKMKGKSIEPLPAGAENEPFILFGVRACDMKSINVLDNVFLSEPGDEFYSARRESCAVVTAACAAFEPTCFCAGFSVEPWNPGGDASVFINGDTLYIRPYTEKGLRLVMKASDVLEQCPDEELNGFVDSVKALHEKQPYGNINLDYWRKTSEKDIFSSDIWNSVSDGCLGCGVCTFVCPTCQCYDIRDFSYADTVRRFRCWDSCMYSDFTKMAHGNPRKTGRERFRQRFMHKLKYYPENNSGLFACVGCGRCVKSCPESLHMIKVLRSFGNV